jgi:hypothetical protein
VLVLLAVLSSVTPVEAAVAAFWRELGGSATGDGVSRTAAPGAVLDVSLAVGSDGRPVVAYAESADVTATQGTIVLRRWTGAAWETLSGATGIGHGSAPQVRISPGGAIYVAWVHDTGDGRLELRLRWRAAGGTTFQSLGDSDAPGGVVGSSVAGPFALAVGAAGRPTVAFVAAAQSGLAGVGERPGVLDGTPQVYVRRWNGVDAWEFVGSDLAGGGASRAVSFASAGAPLVHGADAPTLALDAVGEPRVAFVYVTAVDGAQVSNTDVYVTRWTGGAWTAIGPAVPSTAADAGGHGEAGGVSASATGSGTPSLAIGGDPRAGSGETAVIAWQEMSPAGAAPHVRVRQWDGTAWAELADPDPVGALAAASGADPSPQLAVDADGRAVVAWAAATAASPAPQILVRRWNGVDAWDEVGPGSATGQGISDAAHGAGVPALALTPSGEPAAAWLDGRAGGSAQVFLRQHTPLVSTAAATAEVGRHRLSVTTVGGTGVVTAADGTIDCGPGAHTTCQADYDAGTVVWLTPFPDPDNRFVSWAGCSALNGSACKAVMTADRSIRATFGPAATLTVSASGNGAGRIVANTAPALVCISACAVSQRVPRNASVRVTPQPAVGTSFQWLASDCPAGSTSACTIVLSANRSAVGQFTLNRHRLAVARPLTGRVVTDALPGNTTLDCGTTATACEGVLDYGTSVVLRATGDPGFAFVRWSGVSCLAGGATNASCAFLLRGNVTAVPTFRPRTTVTVTRNGNGAGTVSAPGISCGTDCSQPMYDARPVTFRASPATGSLFTGWGDACAFRGTDPRCAFVPQGDAQTVSATFTLKRYTLTVASRPGGTVADAGPLPDPIACGAAGIDCTAILDHGTPVRLLAQPIPGSRLVGWSGCTSLVGGTCAFVMTGDRTVTPSYRDVTTLGLTKSGAGTVRSSPAGIVCGPTCGAATFDFARGTPLRLTASAPVGWTFTGWSGDCTGTAACVLDTSGGTISRAVGASFAVQLKALDVTVVGDGVVTGPDGLACDAGSTPCAVSYPYGTVAALTPVPAPGFVFAGWSQACTGATTCRPSMTADRVVTATFKQVFGATVTLHGNALVSSNTIKATGITCRGPGAPTRPGDCTQDYLGGTAVTFARSAPPTGRTFRWLGDCASRGSNASCTLTMDANKSVVAEYSLTRLGLTVNVTGPGRVSGLAGALDCGRLDCRATVDYGTTVQLQASPHGAPAGEFLGWTGCTTVVGTSCTLTPTAARTVGATFGPAVTGLSVGAAGADGSVPLARGARRQYSAIATFSDGTRRDVTAQARWVSADTSVATVVSTTGLVTAGAAGTTDLTATYETAGGSSAAGTIPVMTDTILTGSVSVSCVPYGEPAGSLACLPRGLGFEVECRATAAFVAGGTHDVTDQAVWRVTSTTIARPIGLTQFGDDPVVASFRIDGAGTAAIYATVGSVVSAKDTSAGSPWVVHGATLAVESVAVASPVAPVSAGSTVALQARAGFAPLSNGAAGCPVPPAAPPPRDFSLLTDWDTEPPDSTVATVNVLGEVETFEAGQVGIRWRYQAPGSGAPEFSGTAPLTVLP